MIQQKVAGVGDKIRWKGLSEEVISELKCMDWKKPFMPRDKQEECWHQWCAGECFTAGSPGEEKALICSVCQFPWCKYFYTANFKLPAWYCGTQNWGKMCKMGSHYPAWMASNTLLVQGYPATQVGNGSWPMLRDRIVRLMGLERKFMGQ